MNKLVSIVLPTYNGEKYIAQSIESILHQTYTNWELVIVNDCSTDGTLNIVKEYKRRDSRIKVVNNLHNLKLPRSLNVGFSECNGDYYTWTSDDNMYDQIALEEMVTKLDEDTTVGMVYSDSRLIDSEGKPLPGKKQDDVSELYNINCIGACFLYRADIAKEIGEYDAGLFLAEDYDYWVRIYQKAKIVHLEKTLYTYRLHGNSLTSTKVKGIKDQTTKLKLKYFDFWQDELSDPEFDKFVTRMLHESTDESLSVVQRKIRRCARKYCGRVIVERSYRLVHSTPIWGKIKELPLIKSIRKDTRNKVMS